MAEDENIKVESVLTNDDVAVEDSLYTAGRRGVGVTVLAEKIAGAKAEAGGSLEEVAAVARKVNDNGRSFGVAFTSAWTPASPTPTFEIGVDEMEFGVGIHGEPGRRREKIRSAAEIVEEMADAILGDLQPANGASVLAFVNGLGGTPAIDVGDEHMDRLALPGADLPQPTPHLRLQADAGAPSRHCHVAADQRRVASDDERGLQKPLVAVVVVFLLHRKAFMTIFGVFNPKGYA